MKHIFLLLTISSVFFLSSHHSSAQDTPQVPQTITFAGQTIDLTPQDRYERMDRELISFTYSHTVSTLMLKRSGRFFPIIEPILKEYGIPEDLKYLCVIESTLDPKALSSAGAAGLWQFTKATAKEYGLEIREGVDERYNIEKETRAACRFLQKAYDKYGDWTTVAASYNGGLNGITRRVENQRRSCALDLWLVEETARYMYRILAAKMLFECSEEFGFYVPERYPCQEPAEIVKVTGSIENLVDFAEKHGVSYAQLKMSNLWLRGSRLDNKEGRTYSVIIPRP